MALFESYERRIDKINGVLQAMVFLLSKKPKRSQKTLVLMSMTW